MNQRRADILSRVMGMAGPRDPLAKFVVALFEVAPPEPEEHDDLLDFSVLTDGWHAAMDKVEGLLDRATGGGS